MKLHELNLLLKLAVNIKVLLKLVNVQLLNIPKLQVSLNT